MTVYISGRINGDPEYKMKFRGAAMALLAAGHEVLNPAEGNEGLTNAEAMKRALNMLFEADAILLLSDWHQSNGAIIEWQIARYLEKQIIRYGGQFNVGDRS